MDPVSQRFIAHSVYRRGTCFNKLLSGKHMMDRIAVVTCAALYKFSKRGGGGCRRSFEFAGGKGLRLIYSYFKK